jgi:hypothetical protein
MGESKAKSSGGIGKFFLAILIILLIICAGLFAYKKFALDYNGKYANDKLVYTKDFGLCMLVTYHTENLEGDAKGYAIVRIPPAALLMPIATKNFKEQRLENDPSNSEDMLRTYQLSATIGDNDFVDKLSKFFGSDKGTKSYDIGNNGKYFILDAMDYLESLED